MTIQKYSVNQHPIQTILSWISSEEIAIPEIQRPFVWSASKVRDFIDSLYKGYPVGYFIAWRNPTVKLKDGTSSSGKRILIDGQQRVTALMAAVLGEYVINKDYKKVRIKIAFHPQERKFEVANTAISQDKSWIEDITKVFSSNFKLLKFVTDYCQNNENADQDEIFENIDLLKGIVNNHIGLIELNSDLDIETITEIFIRINSQGARLNQADFAMSKIAANETYDGNLLRKSIDYFCHLVVEPGFYQQLSQIDQNFALTKYFQKMSWLQSENDDLYSPSYTDMLRVAFTSEFKRGKLGDLVALLSGRNFETRSYEEEIAESSFQTLEKGILNFINETNFKRFIMILRSSGFIDSSMIRSKNAINFSYIVYLVLKAQRAKASQIESYVRKWFVMSILTGRYSGSPDSKFDTDIKRISEFGLPEYLLEIESADLSDAFWNSSLPQQMNTSVASSPYFNVFLASQVKANDKGFLSKDITVNDLVLHRGDIHHIFPKKYLQKHGLSKKRYNQIANYVMMQSEINIAIGNKQPSEYFSILLQQCQNGIATFGGITDLEQMYENFRIHCLPDGMEIKTVDDYDSFLAERRKLMANKIKHYYFQL